MTEFGNMALVEEREEQEGGNVAVRLPGVRSGDMAARAFKPEVRVYCLRFSPTGNYRFTYSTLKIFLLMLPCILCYHEMSLLFYPKLVHFVGTVQQGFDFIIYSVAWLLI
jgi:periodic tryptophan protein 2